MEAFNKVDLYVPYHQLKATDLEMGKRYPLIALTRLQTKFGPALAASFDFPEKGKSSVILPTAYNRQLTDEDIANINKTPHDIILLGKHFKTWKYDVVERQNV